MLTAHLVALFATAWTLTAIWFLGRKHIAGWVIGIIGQLLWLVYVYVASAWGLLPLELAILGLYVRNLILWRRVPKDTPREKLDEYIAMLEEELDWLKADLDQIGPWAGSSRR